MLRETDEGVVIVVRLTPRAGKAAIGTPVRDADGAARLPVSVTAPPTDNLANDALIALMAKTWKIPRSAISIVAGARGREKKVLIRGEPEALRARIAPLLGDVHD